MSPLRSLLMSSLRESHSVVSDSLQPHGLYSPWNSGVSSCFPSPGDLPNPRMEPRSPVLQVDSLPAEPQGKSKNPGVGSLSLLQEIFQTQGSNAGLRHYRQIRYQLSHQESPRILEWVAYPFSRGVFLTQESNRDLLHCRWILYQLSY